MSNLAARLKYFHLACLSRPACDRTIYRVIRRNRVQRILEIGIGSGLRAQRMISLAQRTSPGCQIHYTGIDLFEARESAALPGLSLKDAYRLLKATPARFRLTPGDPLSALSRVANLLVGTDLVIISSDVDEESLSRAWRFVPRMLHAKSQIYVQREASLGDARFEPLSAAELTRLAAVPPARKAA